MIARWEIFFKTLPAILEYSSIKEFLFRENPWLKKTGDQSEANLKQSQNISVRNTIPESLKAIDLRDIPLKWERNICFSSTS